MSYKHNNLMAMRQNYWSDDSSPRVTTEKQFLKQFLMDHQIFENPSLDDVKYFFFSLPSVIIIKAYALGFIHETVVNLMKLFISEYRVSLSTRAQLPVKYRL